MLEQYVKKILTSRVYDVAVETPLQSAGQLSKRLGNQILLKREDLQPVFSFKIRGAYNKLAQLSPEELARGVLPPRRATTPKAWPWPRARWASRLPS